MKKIVHGIGIVGNFQVADRERPACGMWHRKTTCPDRARGSAERPMELASQVHSAQIEYFGGVSCLRNWHRKTTCPPEALVVDRDQAAHGIGIARQLDPKMIEPFAGNASRRKSPTELASWETFKWPTRNDPPAECDMARRPVPIGHVAGPSGLRNWHRRSTRLR